MNHTLVVLAHTSTVVLCAHVSAPAPHIFIISFHNSCIWHKPSYYSRPKIGPSLRASRASVVFNASALHRPCSLMDLPPCRYPLLYSLYLCIESHLCIFIWYDPTFLCFSDAVRRLVRTATSSWRNTPFPGAWISSLWFAHAKLYLHTDLTGQNCWVPSAFGSQWANLPADELAQPTQAQPGLWHTL